MATGTVNADNYHWFHKVTYSASDMTPMGGTMWTPGDPFLRVCWNDNLLFLYGRIFFQNPTATLLEVSMPYPGSCPPFMIDPISIAYRINNAVVTPHDWVQIYTVSNTGLTIKERNTFAVHSAANYAYIVIPPTLMPWDAATIS